MATTDFAAAARLGACLVREYAEDLFGLLVRYRDISASEAASRLNLHIRTAQDFLETLTSLGIVAREEVYERKRPYCRYALKTPRITLDLDLAAMAQSQTGGAASKKIRERKDADARFSTARNQSYISHVAIWTGDGREREERKISLTQPQGLLLYHLPFPTAEPLSVADIMKKAGVDESLLPEILDIVDLLENYGVIEAQ